MNKQTKMEYWRTKRRKKKTLENKLVLMNAVWSLFVRWAFRSFLNEISMAQKSNNEGHQLLERQTTVEIILYMKFILIVLNDHIHTNVEDVKTTYMSIINVYNGFLF